MRTIDEPDGRYDGLKVPETLVMAYAIAARVSPEESSILHATLNWRCSGGTVLGCQGGPTLIPCTTKFSLDRTPPDFVTEYCRQNPEAAEFPTGGRFLV